MTGRVHTERKRGTLTAIIKQAGLLPLKSSSISRDCSGDGRMARLHLLRSRSLKPRRPEDDGAPFIVADVKYTFDVVRYAKDVPADLRINARKEWYSPRLRSGLIPQSPAFLDSAAVGVATSRTVLNPHSSTPPD